MSRLSDELLDEVVARHPVPIADAVVALVHAEGPHERRDRVVEVFRATLRYLSAVALAARLQTGPSKPDDKARELLRSLRQRALTDGQWLHLSREVTRPYATAPATHPLPVLIELLHGSRAVLGDAERLLGMRTSETVAHGTTGDEDEVEKILAEREPQLARLLSSLGPLHASARLVIPLAAPAEAGEPQHAWQLMGATPPRGRWRRVQLASRLEPGGCVLVDAEGRLLVPLDPAVRFGPPSPGAVEELFFLDGRGPRRSARYIALPSSAELHVRDVWRRIDQEIAGEDRAAADAGAKPAHPYPGLTPFGIGDAEIFFGREEEVQSLANRVRAQPMLTVTGPSGSGKSSLLRAGVAAALMRERAGYRERGERTVILFVRPGTAPMRELAAVIERELPEVIDPDDDRELSAVAPKLLAARIRDLAAERGVLLVLCVDQAEELLTLATDRAEAEAYAELLAALGSAESGPTRVVLAVREDFFARLSELRALRGLYDREVAVLGAPDRDALLRALVEPARRFDASYEAGLAERMVDAVGAAAGALPLLQFAARALWDRADGRTTLTAADYEAIGGVDGALGRHADATLDALPPSRQSAARPILLRLLTPSGTRATVRREALLAAADKEDAAAVLDALESARLVTARQDAGGDAVCELAHESLAVHWPRFARWRAEDTEGAAHLAALSQAASAWISRGRRDELLWRGDLLAEHRAWQGRTGQRLTGDEQAFIAAGESAASAARTRRIAAVAGVIIALGGFAVFAALQWINANESLQRAEENGRVARFQAERATEESGRATRQSLLLRAREYAASGHTPQEMAVLRVLARGELGDEARRMAILDGGFLWKAHGRLAVGAGAADPLAMRSADGRRFAARVANDIHVWDARTGDTIRTVSLVRPAHVMEDGGILPGASLLGISPTGRFILAGECPGSSICSVRSARATRFEPEQEANLRLIDVDTGRDVWRQEGGRLRTDAFAFAADDSAWAYLDGGTVTITPASGPAIAVTVPEGCGAPIALSADGRLALTCGDHVEVVGARATPGLISTLTGAEPADALAFLRGGRWLVATGRSVVLWDVDRALRFGTGRFEGEARQSDAVSSERFQLQSNFRWTDALRRAAIPRIRTGRPELFPPWRSMLPAVAFERDGVAIVVPDARVDEPLGLLAVVATAPEGDHLTQSTDAAELAEHGEDDALGHLAPLFPPGVSYPDPVQRPCLAAAGDSRYTVHLLDHGRRMLLYEQEVVLRVDYGDRLLDPPGPVDEPLRYRRPAAPLDASGCLLWETQNGAAREDELPYVETAVRVASAGGRVAWESYAGTFLRPAPGAAPVPIDGHDPTFSPSGDLVATAARDEPLRFPVYDARNGRLRRTVTGVAAFPPIDWVDDRHVIVPSPTGPAIIDVETGDPVRSLMQAGEQHFPGSSITVAIDGNEAVVRRAVSGEVIARHRLRATNGTRLIGAADPDGVLAHDSEGAYVMGGDDIVPVEAPSSWIPDTIVADVRGSEIRMIDPEYHREPPTVYRWELPSGRVQRVRLALSSLRLDDPISITEAVFVGPERLLVRFATPGRVSALFDLRDGSPIWVGDIEAAGGNFIASEGRLFRPVVDVDALLQDTGRRTNFRVCQDDLRAVPVHPAPPPDSIWAPASACAH